MNEKTVFLSYRRDGFGKPFARLMERELKREGYDCFLDVDGMGSGDWANQIRREIPDRALHPGGGRTVSQKTPGYRKSRCPPRELLHELDGLPLALEQARAYMAESGRDVTGSLEIFRAHRPQLLDNLAKGSQANRTVAATWGLAFRRVAEEIPETPPPSISAPSWPRKTSPAAFSARARDSCPVTTRPVTWRRGSPTPWRSTG
uniref:TIR domain-containing protein n=1 Tax=Candidatus Kentrum sp. SD TaxID=2126332 RepID=A0A451BIH9_9GAMM|nr:MAG: hypothetical protein BECKSD772F_GA0070984_10063 [Candidatus Kentron sp. SD]VFK44896.1 MAG: hypothetical protein BECKSD772E_GA0070983_10458 [Candidatus Kentron sp. SD]VFK78036.1 MAG: hypothetical protein BECKSD772D_GA0070982_100539 [Candidatus Kentron sp. SD]